MFAEIAPIFERLRRIARAISTYGSRNVGITGTHIWFTSSLQQVVLHLCSFTRQSNRKFENDDFSSVFVGVVLRGQRHRQPVLPSFKRRVEFQRRGVHFISFYCAEEKLFDRSHFYDQKCMQKHYFWLLVATFIVKIVECVHVYYKIR